MWTAHIFVHLCNFALWIKRNVSFYSVDCLIYIHFGVKDHMKYKVAYKKWNMYTLSKYSIKYIFTQWWFYLHRSLKFVYLLRELTVSFRKLLIFVYSHPASIHSAKIHFIITLNLSWMMPRRKFSLRIYYVVYLHTST